MDIFGENTLRNLGEVEIKPLKGHVGDSGISRILYESELEHTQILTAIYESDFEELNLVKQGLVHEAEQKFSFSIKGIRELISNAIRDFIGKIEGWWDDLIGILIKTKANVKGTYANALEKFTPSEIKVSFKAGANIFDLLEDGAIYKKTFGNIEDAKMDGHEMSKGHLETLSVGELKELREYIRSDQGKSEMFGKDHANKNLIIKNEIESILGPEKHYTSVSKEDAKSVVDMWVNYDEIVHGAKKSKEAHLKMCKQKMADFDKTSTKKDGELVALVDQCMYEYFRLYREMVLLNCKIFFDVIKEVMKVSKSLLPKLTVGSVIQHEYAESVDVLFEECIGYEIDRLFEGELV